MRGRHDECPSADRRGARIRESYTGAKEKCVRKPEDEEIDLGGRRRRRKTRKKKEKKKKRPYSVCPEGTERVASVFVGNAGRGRKGGHPSHPTTTHVGGDCVAEEAAGGGMAPRQSSLRAFQYIARAFEVAGFRKGSGTRRGYPPPRCYGGGWSERRY